MNMSQAQPPWREDVILWQKQLPNPGDWRQHRSLQGKFHPEYPDDLEVLFRDTTTDKYERMWVRVIAFDPLSGEYLGILINSPDVISTTQQGDNVAFRLVAGAPNPVALDIAGDYRRGGLPAMASAAFFDAMAQGLNQYRRGNFGHNQAGIDASIAHFRRCQALVTNETEGPAKFFLHFFLARCFAEKYETLAAIDAFQRAVSLRPDDEDAQMGLLAELSVLAHTPPAKLPREGTETWERRFVDQVATIRNRFPRHARSNKRLDILLGGEIRGRRIWELTAAPVNLTPEELARIERIGAGVFRWKFK